MVALTSLWLPIVLTVVAIFFASSIIWMALPIHKKDFKQLGAAEESALSAIRSWGLSPGVYMFPMCDPKATKDNAVAKERLKTGPWGNVTLLTESPTMGKCLGMWVVNIVILTVLIAYVTAQSNPAGAGWVQVVQVAFTTALLAYGGSCLTDSIWKGRPWAMLPGAIFDAMVYAAITSALFAWLWPGAAGLGDLIPKLPS